jgi:hypothetical protein
MYATTARAAGFSTAFFGLQADDLPNLNLLVNATYRATDQFLPAAESAPGCVSEVEKFSSAVDHIAADLGINIIGCELSLIANPRALKSTDRPFFSTYLWSKVNGPEFLMAYNRAMNNMTRVRLGEAPIVTHPDFVKRDVAFVEVQDEPIRDEEVDSAIDWPRTHRNIYVRRYAFSEATRSSDVVERVIEFRGQLLASMGEIDGEYGAHLHKTFSGCRLLVVPLFRQGGLHDEQGRVQVRGDLAGALFAFYRVSEHHEESPDPGARLTQRLSWLFAEGFSKESQAVFGQVSEQRDVLYNMIHTTVNALNVMNVQAIEEFLVARRPKSAQRSAAEPGLKYRLTSKRRGEELDLKGEQELAAQIRTAHQLQSMSAALLSITEMSFHPGVLREKFQAQSDRRVLELLADCERAVNDMPAQGRPVRAPLRLEPSPNSTDALGNYGQWVFPAGYVHQSVIWQIVFELLGNARHFGEERDGIVNLSYEMMLSGAGADEQFIMRLRNRQLRSADSYLEAPTGILSLSSNFLKRANSFLEAARVGRLFVSSGENSEFEATLQLQAVSAERSALKDGACIVPPVIARH